MSDIQRAGHGGPVRSSGAVSESVGSEIPKFRCWPFWPETSWPVGRFKSLPVKTTGRRRRDKSSFDQPSTCRCLASTTKCSCSFLFVLLRAVSSNPLRPRVFYRSPCCLDDSEVSRGLKSRLGDIGADVRHEFALSATTDWPAHSEVASRRMNSKIEVLGFSALPLREQRQRIGRRTVDTDFEIQQRRTLRTCAHGCDLLP